jgi:hypothetical protein
VASVAPHEYKDQQGTHRQTEDKNEDVSGGVVSCAQTTDPVGGGGNGEGEQE